MVNKVLLICLFLLTLAVFSFADSFYAGSVTVNDLPSAPAPAIQLPPNSSSVSIVYYLKVLNSKLVNQNSNVSAVDALRNSSAGNAQSVSDAEKAKVSDDAKSAESSDSSSATDFSLKTVSWNNVLNNNTATIVFPELVVGEETHSLKVVAHPRNAAGLRFLEVWDNGVQKKCNSGFWRGLWKVFWLADSIVLGWGEGSDYCSAVVGGYHILSVSISGSDMQTIKLVSPIIPSNCPSEINHTAGVLSGNVQKPTCSASS